MTWLKTTATVRDIADVVAQLVERFHPQRVVLFGSYAYGTPTPDSDVDLLVVMETPLRHAEQAVEIRKAVDCPFPVDLLVRTPQHIAKRVALGDVFLREILTKGVVLYANDTGMGEQSRGHCPSGEG
jgi:predicted nucleotidyltransferase